MASMKDRSYVKILVFFSAILLILGLFIYLKYKQIVSVKEDISESVEAESLQNVLTEELPSEFPEDFPLYPGMQLENSFVSKGEEIDGVSVIWKLDAQSSGVYDYYKEKLVEKGFSVKTTNIGENSYTLAFEKDANSGFVGITEEEIGGSIVTVTMGIKRFNESNSKIN
ncbi:MAG: hypothetical protein US53_C0017G0004 [Candidatus Woesebacteria bacterium GW2011_GWA1_37_7]|uniref:Uncharacterized protein n=1 Tax=Candidatus Woesebacteria bacterium GW2011_GWA1_37_7 TaxID=1618545 RepID=A0A0G0H5U0_9BACT|nr:MAG: hypothetical protein US53_C0017G0004 [Candidatus Woesebacteria bacterium GW2011_GWA1_37_7]